MSTRLRRAGPSHRRVVRGSFGQWTTDDRTGPVRDHRSWDASLLAVLDGGGCLRPTHDPTNDSGDGHDNDHTGHDGRPTGRPRTTPSTNAAGTSRKGGRR